MKQHTAGECHACETDKPKPWWKRQSLWALALLAAVIGLGAAWAPAAPVAQGLRDYLMMAGPAVALGLVLGGIIDRYIPKEYISLWLTGRHRRTIFASAVLGFLASSCSHGALALSVELYRKGASIPAVITFLLASPWASLSMTLLIVSLLGWKGLLIIGLAIVIAGVTGFLFQRLEQSGTIPSNPHVVAVDKDFSILRDIGRRFRGKSWSVPVLSSDLRQIAVRTAGLADMVLFWVAFGFTLSALFGAAFSHEWWVRYLGPTPLGLLTTLGLACVIEVCSEGTAPLAVELYRQTGALGNAFAFLMAGVVTDFTELSVLWANLGRKAVFWLLAVTLPQVFLLGILMNLLRL